MNNQSKNNKKPSRWGLSGGERISPTDFSERGLTPRERKDSSWFIFGLYGAVGMQLSLAVVGGWLLGNYLDKQWNTEPWFALTGLILGFVGGLINLLRILNWRQKRRQNSP